MGKKVLGKLCLEDKHPQSHRTARKLDTSPTHHGTRICIFFSKLQSQIGHRLGHTLHRHRLIVGEPVVLEEEPSMVYLPKTRACQQPHQHTAHAPALELCLEAKPSRVSSLTLNLNAWRYMGGEMLWDGLLPKAPKQHWTGGLLPRRAVTASRNPV